MDLSAVEERSGVTGRSVHTKSSHRILAPNVCWWLAPAILVTAGLALFALVYRDMLGITAAALLVLGAFVALIVAVVVVLKPALLRQKDDQLVRLLGMAIDASPEGRLITDARGVAAYANRAYRELVAAGEDRLAPDPSALAGVGEENSNELARLASAAKLGHSAEGEVEVITLDNNHRWFGIKVRPLGEAGQIMWYVSDIGARKELDHMVAEQQAELSAFLDNAPVGFFAMNREGRFLFVNSTLADWLGRKRGEIMSQRLTLADLVVAESPNEMTADDVLAGASFGRLNLCGTGDNTFSVDFTQQAVFGSDGNLLFTRGSLRDLTQEKALQSALQTAEERFRRFFDFAPVGVVSIDANMRVVETNAAFRSMTGDLGDGGLGQDFRDLVSQDDRGELTAVAEATLAGDSVANPIEVHLRGQSQRVAQLYASRFTDGGGEVSGAVMHLIDTTEQKNLELQFAQSQKMQAVGQLAGGIAHDFNNLLTAMIGFCDLLLMRHQAGDESFSDIMQVKQNANRAANLVRQLLAFSRQQTLRPRVLDITDVLTELSHLLRRLIGENIELKMVHGRDLGLVKVDYGQLEQVIINLAVNARDAMTETGGALTISTGNVTAEESTHLNHELMPPGEYVMIAVSDTGHGIPGEHLGKIFEPFFTTKEVGAGTGLGLSTVYGIVKQTGGFIFPESRAGEGAIFRIYLPRYRQEVGKATIAPAADQSSARDLTGKGLVLLVEDEDAVRTFAARALRNKGYTVLEADSGESALNVVEEQDTRIDLLISDVVMPQMDGPTLVKKVRERRPETKIIFISGYAEDAFRRSLDQRDAREINFLPKPFSLKQLAGKVKEVMTADLS